jgi:hypothetical protein
MRSLLITTHFPQSPERSNVGVFQRMRLMLEVARQASSHIKVLFLVDPDRPIDKDAILSGERSLQQWWPLGPATIDVASTHRELVRLPSGLLARYLPGTSSFF